MPPDARITEFRHLASYNWIESPTPTIAVPGSPAKCSPPNGPIQVKKGTGYFYAAQNVDLRSVDVVTDRNNIRNLLSFVDQDTSRDGVEEFVIKVELIGETALFSREGEEYRFGGLKFLVRNEVDGYVSPVAMEGVAVPSEQCREVNTRVAHKTLQMEGIMPQFWASQTTKIVRAYHTSGLFQPPVVEDVTKSMKRWEQYNEGTLKKLAAVIAKILDVAKRSDGPVQVKCSAAWHQLVLSKTDSRKMLPDDLYSKWNPITETEDSAPVKTPGMAMVPSRSS
ncbi:uncharacterized protein BKA55DRAFT_715688 [Fusarium redolens]|uniref:Uncharacterized protein n=1 Tax=Fusarium redolens TaxID=48865 RepID=A0A9P9JMB9_FUSRE|nr:uncharacterized protein BKA55DRAFT_715688 [Fusarium redolens]KAH7230053.1 hypothetical protein BKA55DRAFT_715688 [Fusarium redolens]